jgi:hypothetical protein
MSEQAPAQIKKYRDAFEATIFTPLFENPTIEEPEQGQAGPSIPGYKSRTMLCGEIVANLVKQYTINDVPMSLEDKVPFKHNLDLQDCCFIYQTTGNADYQKEVKEIRYCVYLLSVYTRFNFDKTLTDIGGAVNLTKYVCEKGDIKCPGEDLTVHPIHDMFEQFMEFVTLSRLVKKDVFDLPALRRRCTMILLFFEILVNMTWIYKSGLVDRYSSPNLIIDDNIMTKVIQLEYDTFVMIAIIHQIFNYGNKFFNAERQGSPKDTADYYRCLKTCLSISHQMTTFDVPRAFPFIVSYLNQKKKWRDFYAELRLNVKTGHSNFYQILKRNNDIFNPSYSETNYSNFLESHKKGMSYLKYSTMGFNADDIVKTYLDPTGLGRLMGDHLSPNRVASVFRHYVWYPVLHKKGKEMTEGAARLRDATAFLGSTAATVVGVVAKILASIGVSALGQGYLWDLSLPDLGLYTLENNSPVALIQQIALFGVALFGVWELKKRNDKRNMKSKHYNLISYLERPDNGQTEEKQDCFTYIGRKTHKNNDNFFQVTLMTLANVPLYNKHVHFYKGNTWIRVEKIPIGDYKISGYLSAQSTNPVETPEAKKIIRAINHLVDKLYLPVQITVTTNRVSNEFYFLIPSHPLLQEINLMPTS